MMIPNVNALRSLLLLVSVVLTASEATTESPEILGPSHHAARANAFRIFNDIHSAARQWGSSINHNGFGFIPATMPRGTLLYHGRHDSSPPEDVEWLAFEPEHAALFARTRLFSQNDTGTSSESGGLAQQPLSRKAPHRERPPPDDPAHTRGYFQTFQARRDLNLLYLDGMAAAKINWGPLDSQDCVLRGKPPGYFPLFPEEDRAEELCEIITPWGYDGLVRMEIGFEVIHCNISDSMAVVSNMRTVRDDDHVERHKHWLFHHARAVSQRYDDIGAKRLELDFSSMITGLFFPLNTTSLTPGRPDLQRLGSAKTDQLRGLKAHVERISREPRRFTIRWQGVVDQIVTWLGDRLALMTVPNVDLAVFIEEVELAVLPFFDAAALPDDLTVADFKERIRDATERCSKHFIMPAYIDEEQWSAEDKLIYTAVSEVTGRICAIIMRSQSSLVKASQDGNPGGRLAAYRVRRTDTNDGALRRAARAAQADLKSLVEQLAWPVWKKTRPCMPDELLYIAMWPFGDSEDHWNPSCRTMDEVSDFRRIGYFHPTEDRIEKPATTAD